MYRHSGSGMHGNGLQVSGRMNCVELEERHVISSFTFTESETVSVSQYWDGQVTVLRSNFTKHTVSDTKNDQFKNVLTKTSS